MSKAGTIIRAFELARGRTCQCISDIRRQLEREGYEVSARLDSRTLKKQLNDLIKASK